MNEQTFNFRDIWAQWDFIAEGIGVTLVLTIVTMVSGLAIGVAGAAARLYGRPLVAGLGRRLCRGDPQHAAAGAALHRLLRPAEPRIRLDAMTAALIA